MKQGDSVQQDHNRPPLHKIRGGRSLLMVVYWVWLLVLTVLWILTSLEVHFKRDAEPKPRDTKWDRR